MQKDPDLAFSDRFGRRNTEYISLGCDILPVLRGRSPIQVYADFMRDFRDTFRPFLGTIITVRFYADLETRSPINIQFSSYWHQMFMVVTSFCRECRLAWVLVVN